MLNSKKLYLITFSLLFIFAMHFYVSNTGGEALQLPFNAISIAFVSFLILIAFYQVNQYGIKYDNFAKALIFFYILILIPFLWSDFNQGLTELLRFTAIFLGILFYLSLLQIKKSKSFYLKLLLLICAASLIQAMLALYQYYLFIPTTYHFDLSYGRPYGVFQQTNVLASFVVTGLSISLFILSQYENLSVKLKAFLYCTVFTAVWVTLLCESRVGYLTMTIVITGYLVSNTKKKYLKRILLLLLAVSTALTFTLPYKGGDEAQGRKYSTAEIGPRAYIYKDTLKLIAKKPIFGGGYGSFHRALLNESALSSDKRSDTNIARHVAHPHNELLYWYAEGGVITLIAFLLLLVAFMSNISKAKNKYRNKLLLLLIPITLHLMVELPFYHSIPHYIVFMVLLAFINEKCDRKKANIKHSKLLSTIKVLSLILFILVTSYSLSAIHTSKKVYNYVRTHNPEFLNNVVNPFSDFKSITILSKSVQIENAILTNNTIKLVELVNWSTQFLDVYPSAYIRFEKIRMLKQLKYIKQAKYETEIAKFLYPQYVNAWNTGNWADKDKQVKGNLLTTTR